jgi:DNA-binding winged helix-turn-helix (wHTH) protein
LKEQCFQIGEFFLDPANRLLQHGGAAVSLSPKAFDALVYLVQNPGRLLTREELIRALWPDSHVEEGNLSVHIFQVRRALGVAADGRAYIQTVPKKGYRFNAEVKVVDQPANGGRLHSLLRKAMRRSFSRSFRIAAPSSNRRRNSDRGIAGAHGR